MDEGRDQQYPEEKSKPSTPWGFFLVLAAIVVVAIVYSVSIFALKDAITPETVFGAMAACFTVIGTLVGTYFGIKAGLDGQEKVRQTLHRPTERSRERPRDGTDGNRDRSSREPREDQQGETRQHRDQRRVDLGDRQEWTGGSA